MCSLMLKYYAYDIRCILVQFCSLWSLTPLSVLCLRKARAIRLVLHSNCLSLFSWTLNKCPETAEHDTDVFIYRESIVRSETYSTLQSKYFALIFPYSILWQKWQPGEKEQAELSQDTMWIKESNPWFIATLHPACLPPASAMFLMLWGNAHGTHVGRVSEQVQAAVHAHFESLSFRIQGFNISKFNS